ncbi:TonB-dependent receptor [Candidatus Nitrotoga sp. AM1P]|uniref:TonB-dependent receptor n=1 Tax=Candidatus Nitrotoga sp. AM1P TaxID=2559597 RepID=UPI0010B21482|nr:TonB-dependent receptor [Candidatus Nitrotoga sp. AM1P]BBJ22379.1 TonB-dependent receptor [Candidatus Nitrotoga sp. AM1P]
MFMHVILGAALFTYAATRKSIYLIPLLFLAFIASAKAHAADSMLSVTCKDEDRGAEIFINDKFKGKCPLSLMIPAGKLKLEVHKKVDALSNRVFEQEIRVGQGVDKNVKVLLGAAQLNDKGKQLQARRLSLEQAELKRPGKEGTPETVATPVPNFAMTHPVVPPPVVVAAPAAIIPPVMLSPQVVATEQAENEAIILPPIVVTANPLGSALFDLVSPVSVLSGKDLSFRQESTLGETLSKLPGVSSTYFGPNASRPVIRGLDGDRVRIMQNGVGMLDVSALSPDHATTVEPLVVDRIEVVRGPATLMYGGSAVGGVVNTLDNRIPQSPIEGLMGRVEPRMGGAANERSGAAVLEGGNGLVALHADIASRRTDDLRIPDFARSDRQRTLDGLTVEQPYGRLPNSSLKSDSGAVGASLTLNKGYIGLSYSDMQSNYGTVVEPDVRVDMNSKRLGVAGEVRELGTFVQEVKFKYGYTDYLHNELDKGEIATTFKNKGYETRVDATHAKLGPFTGAFGVQLSNADFEALGAEAFLPKVNTDAKALFIYEEATFGNVKFTAGGRNEHTTVESAGDSPTTTRFGAAQARKFSANSGALGALYTFSPKVTLAANLSHTERVPTYAELFANGRHVATGQFEVGDTMLSKEKSNGADVQLRWRSGPHSASISGFYTRFQNYIALIKSGQEQEELTEALFRAVKAEFHGFEAEGKFRIYEKTGNLDLNLRGDSVRAKNSDTGESLPRISPMRLGAGLDYQLGKFSTRLDVSHSFKQDRVAENELSTPGYTLTNTTFNYRFKTQAVSWDAYIKGNNLFNQEARTHTSFLKEIAPLPGRGFLLGVRANF